VKNNQPFPGKQMGAPISEHQKFDYLAMTSDSSMIAALTDLAPSKESKTAIEQR
jgi:hypothetical protein